MTKVINILAGPCAGKSTVACGVFYKMKLEGYRVELVTEYAKELVYANRMPHVVTDQLYMLAKQNHRLHNLRGKVDYVVTDSSLLFSLVYHDEIRRDSQAFRTLIIETYNSYKNINFFLSRPQGVYENYGRTQSLDEAIRIDNCIIDMLNQLSIPCSFYSTSNDAAEDIFQEIVQLHKKGTQSD